MTDPITAALNRLQEYAAAHPEHDTDELVAKAHAALAEPVASSPSSMELSNLWDACNSPSVFARAVLARWGNHSADASKMVTPAEGEVAELVAWLRLTAGSDNSYSRVRLTRIAELLERHPAPVPVAEPPAVAERFSDEELLRIAATKIEPYDRIEVGEYEAENNCALEVYGSELIAFARAVLARWGRPAQPAPPAEGEVAELVAWLHGQDGGLGRRAIYARIADLLERHPAPVPVPVPVPVSERLPEPSVKVLAHYFNDLGKGRTICAIWVPAKTRSGSYGDDDFTEYDEESDTFYWPEGWYETIENWDDLGYVKVDEGEVAYWQPLPKWPAHALPLPQGGEVEP